MAAGRRRRGLLYGSESDILRTPHEGKPLGTAQPTVGMISTFPCQSTVGSAAPSSCTARIQTTLINQSAESNVCLYRGKEFISA